MHPNAESPATRVREAFRLARSGQMQSAEALCHEVLRQDADQPDALMLRAVIEVQSGRPAESTVSLRRLISHDPLRAAAHALLGDALSSLKQPQESLECYDAALRLQADLASAHYGRGNVLLDLQRPGEALTSYDRALSLRPNDPEALFNRGNALFRLKDLAAAVDSYDRAIRLLPTYSAAHSNRGSALMLLQRIDAALASFDAALAIDPRMVEARYHRGCALRLSKRPEEALREFEQVLKERPGHVDALNGRGHVLRELHRSPEALTSFDHALALRSDHVDALRGRGDALLDLKKLDLALAAHTAALRLDPAVAESHNSLGNILRALKRYPEAIAAYDESLRIDPDCAAVHCHRATAFLHSDIPGDEAISSYARALELDPDLDYVAGALVYAQQNRADWSTLPAANRDEVVRSVLAGKPVAAPFAFLSLRDSPAAQRRCAETFVAYHCGSVTTAPRYAARRRHDRIRLAYVSSDLREHAVSYLIAGLLEHHDSQRFETIAVSLRPPEASSMGRRVQAAFEHFIDVSGRSDEEVAALMRDMEVDIAVDLNGFTAGFRTAIFAARAAPIQVNYLGFPGTMGASFMDYILADRFVIPPHAQHHYRERVVYLPGCFQANDDRRVISDRAFSRAEAQLPAEAFVFCCLNNTHKIDPPIFDAWMRILHRVPESVLWLLGHDTAVHDNLRREAARRGIDPRRLVFAARVPYAEHLGRLALADLFLDTLPFNAGTSASDALWAGVPLVTCVGETFAARMAGSLLQAVGLPQLITFSLADYETRAIELAQRPAALAELRQHLRHRRSRTPLFDTQRFRRGLEAAYVEMWERHLRGEAPTSFTVSLDRTN